MEQAFSANINLNYAVPGVLHLRITGVGMYSNYRHGRPEVSILVLIINQ